MHEQRVAHDALTDRVLAAVAREITACALHAAKRAGRNRVAAHSPCPIVDFA
jgi:hypothetical protein